MALDLVISGRRLAGATTTLQFSRGPRFRPGRLAARVFASLINNLPALVSVTLLTWRTFILLLKKLMFFYCYTMLQRLLNYLHLFNKFMVRGYNSPSLKKTK